MTDKRPSHPLQILVCDSSSHPFLAAAPRKVKRGVQHLWPGALHYLSGLPACLSDSVRTWCECYEHVMLGRLLLFCVFTVLAPAVYCQLVGSLRVIRVKMLFPSGGGDKAVCLCREGDISGSF